MPGYPKPVGSNAGLPPIWNATMQGIQHAQRMNAALAAGATQGLLPDQWGNATEVYGSNLDQEVTIGATHGNAGVLVRTGIAAGTSGRAVLSGPAITTITLTKGNTSATVGTVSGASLAAGQVIGAANVNDPSSGTATPAITPGTTISAVSGTSVTLSQNAAESGTSLYCAAARFILQQDSGWVPLTLSSGIGAYYGDRTPSARLLGDRVELKGSLQNNTGATIAAGTTVATIPSGYRPNVVGVPGLRFIVFVTSTQNFDSIEIPSAGTISTVTQGWLSTGIIDLDGVAYSLT